jgi:N-dimethylarginine dimethylaminohydrolase
MREMTAEERRIDHRAALDQFLALYNYLAADSIVYLLPSHAGLQDQTYVSNLGLALPHLKESTAVISRFRSEPRVGEASVGRRFLELLNFSVYTPPARLDEGLDPDSGSEQISQQEDQVVYFEGEADVKYLRDNIYIGAYGSRTTKTALTWLSTQFDMNIIPFRITDPRQYHLDCCVFPVANDKVIVCTEGADKSTLREIEKYASIIDITKDEAFQGIPSSLMIGNRMLYDTEIDVLTKTCSQYAPQTAMIARIESICSDLNLEPVGFNLSEFYKSGALLSCMVMQLNYANRLRS